MLTADQLDILPGPILDLYEQLHISILSDIARRVAGLDYLSAAWQVQRMIEAGLLYEQIIKRLADTTGQSEQVLRQIFQQAGVKAIRFDDRIYKAAGLEPLPLNLSPQMTEILSIGLRKTEGLLRNMVQTTAISGQELFINATDLAYMQVSTGALDYNTAIREAVKEAAGKGLEVIYFESGHRDKIDVAVRRSVLTGVNQTVGELQLARADQVGCDLVQTTAHIGARDKGDVPENHEMWQGQVFTRGTDPENTQYPNFFDVTGYGTVTGLMGINCVAEDTKVSGPGIRAGYRRKYSGELVVISTARGHKLTVTPNHPILSKDGWIAAGLLTKGTDVFSRSNFDGSEIISPNINKSQPVIQEVFSTLLINGKLRLLPVSTSDFHGDVTDHEVNVVYPDSLLWNRVQSEANEITIKSFFSFPVKLPSFLLSLGSFRKIGIGSFHSPDSIMSRSGKLHNFSVGHSINSIFHGIRPVVRSWYSKFLKIFSNRPLGYAGGFSNLIFPHTRMIHFQKLQGFDMIGSANIGLPVSTAVDTIPIETINNGTKGTTIFISNGLSGGSVAIHRDHIVNIERKFTQGSFVHVYNLSTEGEWYFANNIITHNCRHNFYPFFKGISENFYTPDILADYASKTATYNGKEMSWYEATQAQRKIEREIRKAKRELAVVEAAGLDNTDERLRVRDLQAQMRDFVKQTGLPRQYPREQVYD